VVRIVPGDGPAVFEKQGRDARSAELLRHERDVLEQVRHPGLVELAPDVDLTDPPMVATFLAGRSTLADRPPSTPTDIATAGAQVAVTLRDLHAAGWAHGAIEAGHCILGQAGGIVLCSLRRAVEISDVHHPAAADDVAQLVAMLRAWRTDRGRGARAVGARLDRVLDRAGAHPTTAAELADALASLISSEPSRPRGGPRRARRTVTRTRASRPRTVLRPRTVRRQRAVRRPPTERSSRRSAAPRHRRDLVAVAVRLVAMAVAFVVLWRLAPPPASATIGASDDLPLALRVAVTAMRWFALAAAAYGTILNATTLAALVSRSDRLSRASARLGPGPLRHLLTGVTSVGVLTSALTSSAGAPSPARNEVTARPPHRREVNPVGPTAAHRTPTSTTTAAPTTAPTPTTTTTIRPIASETVAASGEADDPPPPAAPSSLLATPIRAEPVSTWTVRRGDHLWSIAERTLAVRHGAAPSDEAVRRYWVELISTNRHRLADPDNPDLIFAGQVLLLPAA
jgi:hypothetical protein